MDRQFLEFWGNYLLNVAKGQKQMEEVTEWIRKGFSGFEEMNSLFRKIYGLDKTPQGTPDYFKAWKKAQVDFKKSFADYLNLLGVVPLDVHLELVRKYEELKEKVASQEETIKHLRMLLAESQGANSAEVTRHFDELIKKQSDQFQNLIEGFNKMFKKDSVRSEGEQE
jgi:uncharacterized coiled-coil protein SlyX